MDISLTILIPTWDRPDQVNQRLREIEDLWQGAVPVKIQVNPGKYSMADIDRSLYSGVLEIEQNSQNIGLYANVTYGIRSINTEWLWILGDDDPIRPEAASLILAALRRAPAWDAKIILFNQWSPSQAGRDVVCHDLAALMKATEFGDVVFITASIWRTSFFKANLGLLIDYAYGWAPQALIYLVNILRQSAAVLVIDQPLINYVYSHRWSRVFYLRRIQSLFTHPSIWARRGEVMTFLWPQLRWALQSAAHEQLKSGDITLLAWLQVAWLLSCQHVSCSPNWIGLRRICDIWSTLFEIYSGSQLLTILLRSLRRSKRLPPQPSAPSTHGLP